MIQDDGKSLTVQTNSDDYFKYARVRQTTKNDHADPEKVVLIIEAVRKRPIIWDQRLLCHENLSLIRRAWQQIDIELGPDEEYPLARRKQIWKSKKDYYSFAVNSDTLGKWTFVKAMEFYKPMINFRTTVCLRPTVSEPDTASTSTSNLYDKVVLADKNIVCSVSDKTNVLTFLLKSLHEIGMANAEMMEKHGHKVLEIFQENLKALTSMFDS
uniref:MADF domain-containing protein n=1 Tax=Caenorhabditis tropicalis TaxID=1561998 RepID=A0A1I7UHW8_9PELO